MIALWLIHIIMAENDKYIYFNKWFLCLFLVMFSLGLGACWEIIEYTYDSLMGTNTQQFMATTTGSIFTPEDEPLCGHAACWRTPRRRLWIHPPRQTYRTLQKNSRFVDVRVYKNALLNNRRF